MMALSITSHGMEYSVLSVAILSVQLPGFQLFPQTLG
jgi:hypothetical protein